MTETPFETSADRDAQASLIVFNIFDSSFYDGKLSIDFTKESVGGELPWFFQPSTWVPSPTADGWYGSLSASMTKTLWPYSTGFATMEQALAAAVEWAGRRNGRHHGTR